MLVAVALVGVTVVIHGVGSTYWIRFLRHRYETHEGYWKEYLVFPVIISTALILLLLHVLEMFLWALLYLWLVPDVQVKGLEEAVYFSVITFTTVGFGDITLQPGWRLLSGIEGIERYHAGGLDDGLVFFDPATG